MNKEIRQSVEFAVSVIAGAAMIFALAIGHTF